MTPLTLLILALATWRLSRLLVKEDGPYQLLTRFRARFSLGAFECVYCMSIWVAPLLWLLLLTPLYLIVWWLAIGGAAMLMHRFTGGDHL